MNQPAKVYEIPTPAYVRYRENMTDEQAVKKLREKARLAANKPIPWYRGVNPLYGLFTDAEDYIPPIKRSVWVEGVKIALLTVITGGFFLGLLALGGWIANWMVTLKI